MSVEGTPAVAERIELGEELVALGRSAGGRASAFGLRVLAGAHLELAQGDELVATISDLVRLGDDLRWLPAKVYAAQWQATLAMLEGRWDDARTRGAELRQFARAYRGAAGMHVVQALHIAREVGESLAPAARVEDLPNADLYACASIALAYLDAGNDGEARRSLDLLAADNFFRVEGERRRGAALGVLAEVAAATGAREHAAVLYELLSPHAGRLLSVLLGLACIGGADRYLGMLSTLLERWDQAEAHFERSRAVEQRVRGRALLPRTRYWEARFLVARNRSGDNDAAHVLLDDVATETAHLAMHRLHAQAIELRSQ